jgi:hypothetical protein
MGNPANLSYLAKKGIMLSNYHAVTHPSHPNYIAAVGGDYFGFEYDCAYSPVFHALIPVVMMALPFSRQTYPL